MLLNLIRLIKRLAVLFAAASNPQSRIRKPKSRRRRRRALPLSTRWRILSRDRYRCTACGRSPATNPAVQLHVDHITPASRGGSDHDHNLRTLCADCNWGRGNRSCRGAAPLPLWQRPPSPPPLMPNQPAKPRFQPETRGPRGTGFVPFLHMDQTTPNPGTPTPTPKPKPWLVAAWPGMGNVAIISAGYLVHKLGMKQVGQLPWRNHFDINEVAVKGGIVGPARLPRGMFFRWTNPAENGRDLIVFLAEAQPARGTLAYCHELLNAAATMGAERIVTFASMATDLRPGHSPKVTGVATDAKTLEELTRAEVAPLGDGQIGGLNGVLLGAAAARNMQGLCLLAEIPAFAAAVPNPKAARAALSVFSVLSGVEVSLEELNQHAAAMDQALIEAAERAGQEIEPEEPEVVAEDQPDTDAGHPEPRTQEGRPAPDQATQPKLTPAIQKRVEELFEAARGDMSKAAPLKAELDQLGIFKNYEDRFLDLFRRAG